MKMFPMFLLASGLMILATGCKQESTDAPEVETPAVSSEEEHAHGDGPGEHDHSVAGHAHGVGPHDGTIVDWGGGKYHVEFTVDHDKQQATVYVLGADEKTPAPIDADTIELSITEPEMQVALAADPQSGDPEGKASRFVGTHEGLGVVQEYAGTMTGVVDGTPYSGDFKEEPHGEHDH